MTITDTNAEPVIYERLEVPWIELPEGDFSFDVVIDRIAALPAGAEALIMASGNAILDLWEQRFVARKIVAGVRHRPINLELIGGQRVIGRVTSDSRTGVGIRGINPALIVLDADDIDWRTRMEVAEIARYQAEMFQVTRFRRHCPEPGCVKIEGNFRVGKRTTHATLHTHHGEDTSPIKGLIAAAMAMDEHLAQVAR